MVETKIKHFRLGDVLSVASKGKACYWPNFERGRKNIFNFMLNSDILFNQRVVLDSEEEQHYIKKCYDSLTQHYPELKTDSLLDAIDDFTDEIHAIDNMYRKSPLGYFKRQSLYSKAYKNWQKRLTSGYYGIELDRIIAVRQL